MNGPSSCGSAPPHAGSWVARALPSLASFAPHRPKGKTSNSPFLAVSLAASRPSRLRTASIGAIVAQLGPQRVAGMLMVAAFCFDSCRRFLGNGSPNSTAMRSRMVAWRLSPPRFEHLSALGSEAAPDCQLGFERLRFHQSSRFQTERKRRKKFPPRTFSTSASRQPRRSSASLSSPMFRASPQG